MGTLQEDLALRGIGIGDRRTTFENLNPRDGSATASDYTEAGPRPGTAIAADPKSRLIVEIDHAQGEDLDVYVARPGDPGPDTSSEILFRETDEASDPLEGWRAWNRPTSFGHFFTPAVSPTTGSFDAAVDPESQALILVYNSGGLKSRTFDDGWQAPTSFPVGFTGGTHPAILVLPSGRWLSIIATNGRVFYSDDAGGSWILYSENAFAGLGSVGRSRAVLSGDAILLVIELAVAPFTWHQFVSRDLGATFTEIDQADIGSSLELLALPDGSIGWFYVNSATSQPTFRRTGSAFQLVSSVIGMLVDPGAPVADMTNAAVERDGVMWAIADSGGNHHVWTSTDLGDNWTLQTTDVLTITQDGPREPNGKLIAVDGSFVWFNQWQAPGPILETDIHAFWIAGWQNVGVGPDFGWGLGTGSFIAPQRASYLPIDVPQLPAFSPIGAGSDAIIAPKLLEVITVAQSRSFLANFLTVPIPMKFKGLIQFLHVSGGNLALPECGFTVRLADGVDDFAFSVNFSEEAGTSGQETRFRIRDTNAGTDLVTITPSPNNLGQTLIQFLVDFNGDTTSGPMSIDIFWRFVGSSGAGAQWLTAFSGVLAAAGGPAANGDVRWGHVQSGTAVSRWGFFFYKVAESTVFDDFFALAVADKRGRSIGGRGYPLGFIEGLLPGQRSLETKVVLGALRGGPARLAETFQIPASYDFSIQNVFGELSPSPRAKWRSRDTSLQTLAWTFPVKSRIGDSWILGLIIECPNFISADIDVDTSGAGTYVNLGELNFALDFDGLAYLREGDKVRPDKSTTILAARYLHRNELAGGLFVDAGGTATRIIANTSGRWGPGTDSVQPIITVADNIAGPASGICALMPPRGVFFINLDGVVADYVRGVRIRIAGLVTVTDEPYLESGLIRPFAVTPFGQQPSRGWTQELTPNTSETVSRSGTIRKREEGPPSRRWSWSWPDGVRMGPLRNDDAPNFLGIVGKPPAITKEDVWTLLWGEIEETNGGELGVVACNVIPDTVGVGVVLTDRTLFMWATLDGSGRFDQVLGDEGVDEFGRLSPIGFRELV